MTGSGFLKIDVVTEATYIANENILSPIDFEDLETPTSLLREVEVEFITDTAGILSLTFDGVNYFVLNNNDQIIGVSTFTIFVESTATLNFRFNSSASIILMIGV